MLHADIGHPFDSNCGSGHHLQRARDVDARDSNSDPGHAHTVAQWHPADHAAARCSSKHYNSWQLVWDVDV
jgi:hypothetical protein